MDLDAEFIKIRRFFEEDLPKLHSRVARVEVSVHAAASDENGEDSAASTTTASLSDEHLDALERMCAILPHLEKLVEKFPFLREEETSK